MTRVEVRGQEVLLAPRDPCAVCHLVDFAGDDHAICGVGKEAWADCPEHDYFGNYCKCGKPMCQMCELEAALSRE